MNNSRWTLSVIASFALLFSGCAASRIWESAQFAMPVSLESFAAEAQTNPNNQFEAAYARAVELEQQGAPDCVEAYLQCAEMLWPTIVARSQQPDMHLTRQGQLYQSSVGKLIETAQRFGRYDPVHGIKIAGDPNPRFLPVRHHGFVWQPVEFESLSVVGLYRTPDVIHPHRQDGLGVPLLVQHNTNRPYVYPNAKFAATAVLRTEPQAGGASPQWVLDLVNPQSIRTMNLNARETPLAFDLTAPLAYYSVNGDRQWLTGFVQPNEVAPSAGLTMIEPYQPGKIPVIFIHGLASDALTWSAMGNELFLNRDLLDRYQFWIFSYPTGKPFPKEAARLRADLVKLRQHFDPHRQDPALDQIVLIGHSMGGLISKLQITSSEDRLSRSILRVPIEQLNMTPQMREEFGRQLFFQPSSQIQRVIFIGTPHRGSELASGTLGQFASRLVQYSGEDADLCTQFIQQNPDAFTVPTDRLPTSVDLLRPDSLMLQAVYGLPVAPHIRMHSIVGVGQSTAGGEPGDGVVPVSSARHPRVDSELFVEADHDLHQHPETIIEVVRILRDHANLAQRPSHLAAPQHPGHQHPGHQHPGHHHAGHWHAGHGHVH